MQKRLSHDITSWIMHHPATIGFAAIGYALWHFFFL